MFTKSLEIVYTIIPHYKLKTRLVDIIDRCFFNKDGTREYSYLKPSHQNLPFNSTLILHASTLTLLLWMIRLFLDNIYVAFGHQVVQQSINLQIQDITWLNDV